MKVARNFDINKLLKSNATALWLNQWGNLINQSIQDGLNKGEDINGDRFEPGGEFTHKSTHDGHPHKRPLIRSGRLQKSVRKLPAKRKKLSFTIKSNVKSKARWNIEVDGKKYSGTRSKKGINYGAMHNRGKITAYKTSSSSFIKNKNVKPRIWFGIPKDLLVGGDKYNKMKDLVHYWNKAMSLPFMKDFK